MSRKRRVLAAALKAKGADAQSPDEQELDAQIGRWKRL